MTDWLAARLRLRTWRYSLPVVALLLAAALTATLVHFKLPRQASGYAFLLVIIGSAWWGGYGPGLLATFATLFLGPYLTQPNYTVLRPNLNTMPMVFLISVLISRMAGVGEKLREANALLDERVKQRTVELETANRFLREREGQLIAQAESLSQTNADLEQFAYFASHDIQEPLRMIAVFNELIEEESKAHLAVDPSHLRTVRDSVGRLEVLVRDLLMYSRAIHGDQLEPAEIDLQEPLLVAMANLKPQIEALSARVSWGQLPRMVAEPSQLIQVFQNLIGNALKYRGSADPHILITASTNENEWIVSVKDNGIGIPSEYHDRIFIPFKRLHGQQYPGSGVGLAICRRIIERIGGRIWVESRPGQGATFSFSVPTPDLRKTISSAVSIRA